MEFTLFHSASMLVWMALFYYLIFWFKVAQFFLKEPQKSKHIKSHEKIAILCVFRNEKDHLPDFLIALDQIIKVSPFEIFLVNDHSTDESLSIIEKHLKSGNPRIQVMTPPLNVQGKKTCLDWAIRRHISSETIFVTDADCNPNSLAINHLLNEHRHQKASLSLGLIQFLGKHTLVHQYQKIENTCLVALSTYHAFQNKPSMGNAANMMFEKNDFLKYNPYEQNLHIAGGDDIFLIDAFKKQGLKIHYSNSANTLIPTQTISTWKELWRQRIRWAKKSQFQLWSQTQFSQIIFVFFLFFFWGISIYNMYMQEYVFLLCLWLFKFSGEIFFIRKIFKKIPGQLPPTLLNMVISSFIQSIFIPMVAVAQFFNDVHWKDRRIVHSMQHS